MVDNETKAVVTLQEKNGVDIITNGELARDNYVSFVSEKVKWCCYDEYGRYA